jgi:flagellar hook-basal body complex protein FliE
MDAIILTHQQMGGNVASNIAIDTNRIQAMVEQLRSVASRAQGGVSQIDAITAQLRGSSARINEVADQVTLGGIKQTPSVAVVNEASVVASTAPAEKVDFAQVLKSTLDQVNEAQSKARKMSQSFAMGDDDINLSDVMIASQKSSISFQTSIQVRNKLVSAYRDVMTMQV